MPGVYHNLNHAKSLYITDENCVAVCQAGKETVCFDILAIYAGRRRICPLSFIVWLVH